MSKKIGQISMEYLIIMGFITMAIIGILTVAFFYSNSVKDKIKDTQLNDCCNKIVATAESVFYAGEPSKATITCYLPETVREIEIAEDTLFASYETASGTSKTPFSSNVKLLSKILINRGGIIRIKVEAMSNQVNITVF